MRKFVRSCVCYIVLCASFLISHSVTAGPAENPFENVEIKTQRVSGNVFMLEGAGGNIGVSVGPDGTLIVDDQFAPLAERIQAALEELGGNKPKLVLNTHFHGDHTGSNPVFGRTGTIIAHHNVRVRLLDEDDFPRSGLPVVTYGETINIHFNDEDIEVIHLPSGHTDGDSVVWFKTAQVIHMGDHYFNGRFPFVDVRNGGNVDGFVSNVERVLDLIPAETQVIPGHGALSTTEELASTIATIKQSASEIRTALATGKVAEDVAADIDSRYPGWGDGFITAERWVKIVQADTPARP